MVQKISTAAGDLTWSLNIDPPETLLLPGQQAYREALRRCLLHEGYSDRLLEYPEGLQKNFHTLLQFPEFKASFTHAGKWGGAVITNSPHICSVGIDIENQGRKMHKDLIRKFKHNDDQTGFELLELWTIKEAAYKAMYSQSKKTFYLKDIAIKTQDTFEFDTLKGKFLIFRHAEFMVTIAYLDK